MYCEGQTPPTVFLTLIFQFQIWNGRRGKKAKKPSLVFQGIFCLKLWINGNQGKKNELALPQALILANISQSVKSTGSSGVVPFCPQKGATPLKSITYHLSFIIYHLSIISYQLSVIIWGARLTPGRFFGNLGQDELLDSLRRRISVFGLFPR